MVRGGFCKFCYPVASLDTVMGGKDGKEGGREGESLKEMLLQTGEKELVEASPRDRIWGIGFRAEEAEGRRGEWGENLLGRCLGRVRVLVREMEEDRGEVEGGKEGERGEGEEGEGGI